MGVFVKICGLACEEDVKAVAAMKPDALGFIFWPGSPRYVQGADVGRWTLDVDEEILRVGVFVDCLPDEVAFIQQAARLNVLQLHGVQVPADYKGLGCEIWKVLHLDRGREGPVRSNAVDAFLIDSYSTESPGGTGKTCNWERASEFVATCSGKVLLAGGLNAANVSDAIEQVAPWGVDVSSGVEIEPGRKDLAKVKEFIERCREA